METERLERREFVADRLEVRRQTDKPPVISGYVVVFDAASRILHDWSGQPFIERFAAGAFDAWLRTDPELVALWNHNADLPLARRSRGTLQIAKDEHGLRFEMTPPESSWGADAIVAIQRGDVLGMSFLFEAVRDAWNPPSADGVAQRTVLESVLYEISPVTFPAYPATQVTVRAVRVPNFGSDSRAADEIERRKQHLAVRRRRLDLYRRW